MKLILYFLLLIASFTSFAQDFDNYQPVKANDKIPDDLITLSSDIYEKERKDISQREQKFVKKAQDNFFLESSFGLHDMLYSGKVLFNDPLTKYVEKVAKEVFKSEPELASKIQIFVLKSTSVNAFATNNGMIFITMGMLAQLENEAQLAFILCHEFTHYKKKHVMTGYVETEKIRKGKKDYRNMSLESKVEAKFKFSKDHETEADIDGLDMFLKTNYSLKVLDGVFDVLEYEYLPFDDIVFDKTFFNSKDLKFPNNLFLDKTRNIATPTESDDSKSTHPSIYKRRQYIANKIANQNSKGKTNYGVSEVEFKNVRKVARFELSQLYLYEQHYYKAIFNSYLLLKESPKSTFLKKNIGKSLYALAKYKNNSKLDNLNYLPYDSIEGSSQQVYYFFQTITTEDLSVLALRYLYNLKSAIPSDAEIPALLDDLIKDVVNNDIIKLSNFAKMYKQELTVQLKKEIEAVDTTRELSKYDKIKKSQKTEKILQSTDTTAKGYTYFAFVEAMSDPGFVSSFDRYVSAKNKEDDSNLSSRERAEKRKEERKQYSETQKTLSKRGESMGIEKVVFINPHYAKVDDRAENASKHLEGEEAQLQLNDEIREIAPKANLAFEMIDDIGLKATEVDKFNDFGYLNLWFQERLTHIDNGMEMISIDKNNVDYLVNKYKTKYFCWTGFVGERERNSFTVLYLLGAAMAYPAAPFFLYQAFKPEYQTYFYAIIFDIETGKAIHSKVASMDYKDSKPLRRAHLYDLFYQMKQVKK